MKPFPKVPALLAAALLGCGLAQAGKSTVCTITVNSADEREAFRRNLPTDQYDFVELVERGRPDWLASSCRKGIRCDVLVISGHFAGTEFYSSRPDTSESLPVDEMERVPCSDSCPGLFSQLKEVYLFGCDSLKPEPVRSAMPEVIRGLVKSGQSPTEAERLARALSEFHGESARDRMRRIFPGVPVIYGFSALAPYGRVAGPMLDGYFRSLPADEIGSGRVSTKLLKLFGPSSMVAAIGMGGAGPEAAYRAEACRFYDDRLPTAAKIAAMHRMLGGEMTQVRMTFDRIEKFFASLGEGDRQEESIAQAVGDLSADRAARESYLAIERETQDPAIRTRMIALARNVGWLSAAGERVEQAHMIGDVLANAPIGFGEVELICELNKDRSLDTALQHVSAAPGASDRASQAAALACLGSAEGRARVLRALTGPDERDVQVAQSYLRHRPITDAGELRMAALGIAQMKDSGAQVRALDTLARLHIVDREILDELARLFARTTSLAVQRAIAEIFLRSDAPDPAPQELIGVLRQHRLQSPDGDDLIDTLIRRYQAS
jgi:hypothetical protein